MDNLDYLIENGKYMINHKLKNIIENETELIELFDSIESPATQSPPGVPANTCPNPCPPGKNGIDGLPGPQGPAGKDFQFDTKYKILLVVLLLVILFNTGCSLAFLLK